MAEELTVEDLADLPHDLRYELIDGRLTVLGRELADQVLAIRILMALDVACGPDLLALHSMPVAVDRRNRLRPEVTVVSLVDAARCPIPIAAPILIVDLVTPTWEWRDRAALYAAAGVPHWWTVDLRGGATITEYRARGGGYEVAQRAGQIFETVIPFPVRVDLSGSAAWA